MPSVGFDPRAPRSTWLSGVRLKNFKSVAEAEVRLAPLTVIAGANSAGKSSLLQAVLALTQVSRRRIEGHRFPLNDDLARLGTFDSLRHQQALPGERVQISAKFNSDTRDVRMNSVMRVRESSRSQVGRDAKGPLDLVVSWSVELDGSMEDQLSSAKVAVVELGCEASDFSSRLRIERTSTPSQIRRLRDDTAGAAFAGTLRVGQSEVPVLDAHVSGGQVGVLFGRPPDPPVRVREWFLSLEDQPRESDQLFDTGPPNVKWDKAVQAAVWAIRQDVPSDPDFLDLYDHLPDPEKERLEDEVLRLFVQDDSHRRRRSAGELEALEGRGPDRLEGAQRACARFLGSQVRYVGPLRHAPHQQFASAPDPDLADVGVSGEYVASVLQASRSVERRYPLPPTDDSLVSAATMRFDHVSLLEAVNEWMTYFGLATSIAVHEDVPLVLSVGVTPPGLKREVPLSAVGVGVSQVLPVIVQCLVAGPGSLVVLEQPELHLHPKAQQRLADFLLACMRWGQYLLVESHSEYMILRLRRHVAEDISDSLINELCMLFASRNAAGVTEYKPVELTKTGGIVEWPKDFFDQGPDEAHQLLIAAAKKQRRRAGANDG